MDMYLVQILQNKVLCGVELTKDEQKFLENYKQSENDVLDNWLANNR